MLVVRSNAVRADLYVYILGIDPKHAYGMLRETAGSNHVLTRYFADQAQ